MLRKVFTLALIFTLTCVVAPPRAYAYLDPGSGSYLIQVAIASIAGLGYLVKANWSKVKNSFSQKTNKKPKDESGDELS